MIERQLRGRKEGGRNIRSRITRNTKTKTKINTTKLMEIKMNTKISTTRRMETQAKIKRDGESESSMQKNVLINKYIPHRHHTLNFQNTCTPVHKLCKLMVSSS